MANNGRPRPRVAPECLGRVVGGDPAALSAALERAWGFAARVGLALALLTGLSSAWSASKRGSAPFDTTAVVVLVWHILSVAYAAFR